MLACVIVLVTQTSRAGEALVAVATNFSDVMAQLEVDYARQSGHRLTVVTGSSGKLYAQIFHGAPFALLLSADQWRPRELEDQGLAVRGSRFTYAVGRLALWSADTELLARDGAAVLQAGDFRKLALANPDLAPYGRPALETLQALGVYESLQGRLVVGENVGQAHAMVATGNAELGFVSASYLAGPLGQGRGSRWLVPQDCHSPVRQDVVLLDADNVAARGFIEYLRSGQAKRIIEGFGYATETPAASATLD